MNALFTFIRVLMMMESVNSVTYQHGLKMREHSMTFLVGTLHSYQVLLPQQLRMKPDCDCDWVMTSVNRFE